MLILTEYDVFIFVAQLGIIILFARIFGEIAQKFGQPIIVGEVMAGIVLGPMFFGKFFPSGRDFLFPQTGPHPYLLQGISWLCVLFLLLITGLEIDFRASLKQGKQCFFISILGLISSFIGIYAASFFFPAYFFPEGINPLHVKLLAAMALSVVAIPVIAKILFDLKILRSEVGVKVITSGVLSDVWGWTLLAVLVSLINTNNFSLMSIVKPVVTMAVYLSFTLRYGYLLIEKFLNFIGYNEMDTTMSISLLFSLMLLNGAIAHLLGIHVIFGAFIAGVMAGESDKITPYMRQWIQDFIFAVFAPIFFVLIGMQLHFTRVEILIPIIAFLLISSVCKIGGAFVGGILGGLGRRNSFTVACGLNTQGTMGIIIAIIAHEMGIFNNDLFSAIIAICILSALVVGPLLKWAIKGVRRPLAEYFDQKHVFLDVPSGSKKKVIAAMANLMHKRRIIDNPRAIEMAIWERESVMSTAIGEGVALPHARIPNLKEPILCFFRLEKPVDFESHDNTPVQLFFVELTDSNDDGMQLNLIAQVTRFISSEDNRHRLLECKKEEEIHNVLSFDTKA